MPAFSGPTPADRRFALGLVAIFVLSLPILTPYLRGDGVGFYAYVASFIVDGDLYLEDEFRHADPGACRKYFQDDGQPQPMRISQTGMFKNKYPIGASILWTPFFVSAHAGVLAHNALRSGSAIPADGYSMPYLWVCAAGSALIGLLGLTLSAAIARRLGVEPWVAFTTVLGMWFASGLFVYMYFLPFMAHAHVCFVVALFTGYWWWTYRPPSERPGLRTPLQWGVLGLLAGFLFTTYYVTGVLWIFLVVDGLAMLVAWQRRGDPWAQRARWMTLAVLPAALGVALGTAPHFIQKTILMGAPFGVGYGRFLEWGSPDFLRELFSTKQGLWTWTPIMIPACLGWISLVRRHPALGSRVLLGTFLMWYVLAAYPAGHWGSSFGNRYFLNLSPFFVLGLACALQWAADGWRGRWPRSAGLAPFAALGLVGVLALWNAGLVFQWGTNVIPNREEISFRQVAQNQLTVVPAKISQMLGGFLFDRGSLLDEIEQQDLSEYDELEVRPKGVCQGVSR